MNRRRTLLEERAVVKSLYFISNPSNEREVMDTSLVLVLVLVFVLILVFIPIPSTNFLASNVFVITGKREKKNEGTISTLNPKDKDCRDSTGSEPPSASNAQTMVFPNLPTLPNGSFRLAKERLGKRRCTLSGCTYLNFFTNLLLCK